MTKRKKAGSRRGVRGGATRPAKAIDPTKPLKNTRWEQVAQLVAAGSTQADAYREVYPRSKLWKPGSVYVRASVLHAKVLPRVDELKKKAVSRAVMTVLRRKEALSRIGESVAFADPADYMTVGADGVWVGFGPESKNRGAVAGIESTTNEGGSVITKIKLRPYSDATGAIRELNKMEGDHAPEEFNVKGLRELFAEVAGTGLRLPGDDLSAD